MKKEQSVDDKPNFPKMEEEIVKFWEKQDIFKKTLESTKDGKKFVFFEGPPTANGKPGIHHVLARAYKDIICRYKTMQGFFVERKAGWDTHGLPVELQVEREIQLEEQKGKDIKWKENGEGIREEAYLQSTFKLRTTKDIIEKYGIKKFNQRCKESVWIYKKAWEDMTKRIGYWLDLEHPYVTYENEYIESLWWIIKQIWDKELLYKGYKVVPHCPRCGTALSSHEVAQGYDSVSENSVYVKFLVINPEKVIPQVKDDLFILSWTTTPWTLPGNVALAVGEDIEYVAVEQEGETYILAKDTLGLLEGEYKIEKEFKGKDLIGLKYVPLYDIKPLRTDKAHQVYGADFVTTEDGTGVVHTAVMYGEDDYNLGKKVGLPKHHTVDENGNFTKEVPKWSGRFVKDKDVERGIVNDLRQRELLYKEEMYTHDYPFCWRCNTPLLYYAKDSWFIRMSALKAQLIKNNQDINWVPGYIKQGRFGEWLNELKDWAFSRERYWGTPLPIWECEKCSKKECVGSIDELVQKASKKVDLKKLDLHRPFVDDIQLKCECGGKMRRVREVIDVWFDSGAMPFAQWHYPFANKERIDEGFSFPAEYIAEAIDQTRGWFYTLLAISTLLGKGTPFKNVICLNLILDAKGQKMSKSRGNIVDPFAMIAKYGADTLRWHLFTMNQPGDTKLFDEKNLEDVVKKNWLILWNVLSFWKMYAPNQEPGTKDQEQEVQSSKFKVQSSGHVLDRWVVAKFNALVKSVTDSLDSYQVTEAGRAIGDFITELSTWYVRRSRARFKKEGKDKQQALSTLHHVLTQLAKLLAPGAPFIAEKIYSELRGKQASVHLEKWPVVEKDSIMQELLKKMQVVRQAVELGHALRKEHRLKVRQPLAQFIVAYPQMEENLQAILKEEMNVEEVIFVSKLPSGDEFVSKEAGSFKVALDITITDELKQKGFIREIVRHINAMRKDAQLTINDTVTVYYEIPSEELAGIFLHYKNIVCQEVLAVDCLKGLPENVDLKKILEINGKTVTLAIKKK